MYLGQALQTTCTPGLPSVHAQRGHETGSSYRLAVKALDPSGHLQREISDLVRHFGDDTEHETLKLEPVEGGQGSVLKGIRDGH